MEISKLKENSEFLGLENKIPGADVTAERAEPPPAVLTSDVVTG